MEVLVGFLFGGGIILLAAFAIWLFNKVDQWSKPKPPKQIYKAMIVIDNTKDEN